MHFLSVVSTALLFCTSVIGKPTTQTPNQGISFVESEGLLTFDYSVAQSHSRNWIGIYNASGGGPDDGRRVSDSLTWAYTPLKTGRVRIGLPSLPPGSYKAYFLASDGYKSLADPVQLSLSDFGGSVSVHFGNESPFVFSFKTNKPHAKNWLGIWYANGGGPANQQRKASPTKWQYIAKANAGTVNVDVRGLPPGKYVAYLLYDDGYDWLANPIDFFIPGSPGSVSFLVDSFTTLLATQEVPFVADISGLLATAPNSLTTFAQASGANDSWVDVSSTGLISGTPPSGADGSITITVNATTSTGSTAQLLVHIPVQQQVKQLSVISFNIWQGGVHVNDYHKKQLKHILSKGADIVGLQESSPTHGHRLAQALGWYAVQGGDTSIISRYPIVQTHQSTNRWTALQVALDTKGHEVIIWNVHLGYTPYGPYDFCYSHMSQQQVLDREASSGRTPQIQEIVSRMSGHLQNADAVPVLLTGDFNSPSHQDWTKETNRCNAGYVPWPATKYPTDAGLVDSFRYINPDPFSVPGITWSPIYLSNGDYGNRPEPLDRVDFIFYKGKGLVPSDSEVFVEGTPKAEPNQANNEWPSDHRTVRTVFQISK